MKNKNKKNKKEEIIITTTNDEVKRLIKVTLTVLIIFSLFFLITYLVTREDKKTNTTPPPKTEIQYDEIIIGEMLTKNNSEYYVLVTTEKDQFVSLYNSYLSIYKNKDNSIRVYSCNLDSVFNKNFIAEESVFEIAHIKDIRFKETTLVKIKNKQIVNTYEGKENIINQLKEMIK
jgi:ethanolamine utilization protein EutP (predicted NTPase)